MDEEVEEAVAGERKMYREKENEEIEDKLEKWFKEEQEGKRIRR